MQSLKYKFRVLTTYEAVAEAASFYYEISVTHNPFLAALNLSKDTLYEELMKPKIQIIADQQLSIGMYDEKTNELLATILCVDGTTEFTDEPKNKFLKARAALFKESKDKMRETAKSNPKYGELIDILVGATQPRFQNSNFMKLAEGALIQHHLRLGYRDQYGEATAPASQYMYDFMEVPLLKMIVFIKDYEFEGEKVFRDLNYGEEYRHGQPSILFFYISYDHLVEGGFKIYRRIRERITARL